MVVYLFENEQLAIEANNKININMGFDGINDNFSNIQVVNNPSHVDYMKAFIGEVEGDEEHHTLWMNGIDGTIPYEIKEYDQNWFIIINRA